MNNCSYFFNQNLKLQRQILRTYFWKKLENPLQFQFIALAMEIRKYHSILFILVFVNIVYGRIDFKEHGSKTNKKQAKCT